MNEKKVLVGIWCAIVLVVVLLIGVQVKLHKDITKGHERVVRAIGHPTQDDYMRFVYEQTKN